MGGTPRTQGGASRPLPAGSSPALHLLVTLRCLQFLPADPGVGFVVCFAHGLFFASTTWPSLTHPWFPRWPFRDPCSFPACPWPPGRLFHCVFSHDFLFGVSLPSLKNGFAACLSLYLLCFAHSRPFTKEHWNGRRQIAKVILCGSFEDQEEEDSVCV